MNATERYSRQSDLVPAEKLANLEVSVVGVGAVGRNVAIQLAAMGVSKLHLLDFDTVEESNISSQGYFEADIGAPKVEAVKRHCIAINGSISVRAEAERFRLNSDIGQVIFACVDSIETRGRIASLAQARRVPLLIDGRMANETFRVLCAWDAPSYEYYMTTIFPEEEAHTGTCTSKSTIYCASGLACFEAQILAKWLRECPLEQDVMVNLLANQITVLKGATNEKVTVSASPPMPF